MYFPNRPIYPVFHLPDPGEVLRDDRRRHRVPVGARRRRAAAWRTTAHLGGLVVGYLYLKGLRRRPFDEIKYRWLRWKMGRARSRFDVYSGGRSSDDDWKSDWKKHIH